MTITHPAGFAAAGVTAGLKSGGKKSDLQSKRRLKSFSLPRQICMYLARRNTRLSLEEIGGFFGGRDHTTVLYATERIESLVLTDTRLAATVHAVESRIRKGR